MVPIDVGREHALAIWWSAVEAVKPEPLVQAAVEHEPCLHESPRLLVVGAGKAGAAMASGLEAALEDRLHCIEGLVNVPAETTAPLKRIRLHAARPQGVNEPTADGVAGAEEMLRLLSTAGSDDVAVCLLSGGGSALLPAPAPGISLSDKLALTRLLHRSGATIDEMNCVRKHLSRIKGGRLAEAFRGRLLLSLIISDVVGDPLDVIASGPTAHDPTTFREALEVLARHKLTGLASSSVVRHLEEGSRGTIGETPKVLRVNISNRVIGSNRKALDAAKKKAAELGYLVLDLGAFIEGETGHVATAIAGVVRSIRRDGLPLPAPMCLLLGGETTVTLDAGPGKGGRNQEFVLAVLAKLGAAGIEGVTVLSGGTDGEDGPTDAAGAIADSDTFSLSRKGGFSIEEYLKRHDSYHFFERTNGLMKTGLTGTNVMDVRVIVVR
jgi:hydroxypyruvate reductase/glycerate 2-kinase